VAEPGNEPVSFVELVRASAERNPDRIWGRWLPDGEHESATVTFAELDTRSRQVAVALLQQVSPGDRVLVMCEPGLEYVYAFLGCLYAGAIAVPAYPPSPMMLERSLPRLQAVVTDARADYAITTRLLAPLFGQTDLLHTATGSGFRFDCVEDLVGAADSWQAGHIGRGDDTAFLQYTSGSTGDPKGVVVTHRNLDVNTAMALDSFAVQDDCVSVSWLPPYHDMGLIGLILSSLRSGTGLVLMPPDAFLKHPVRWLRAISNYGAYLTASPNFGFELCVKRVPEAELATLDLSSWRVAINGAEPISVPTLDAFTERFGGSGFRRDTMRPSYGMAEATLLVSAGSLGVDAREVALDAAALEEGRAERAVDGRPARVLATCGHPPRGGAVLVLSADGSPLPDGQVGELAVVGAHVAAGYWQLPADAVDPFGVAPDGQPMVRTGDLGCVVDGELLITGRIKDLIVVRGRNHYPQDIERTVDGAHSSIRPGCAAAVSVSDDSGEALVVVAETRPVDDYAVVRSAISSAVNATHGIRPDAIVFVETRTIPKTSSGKLQRAAVRAAFLAGDLTVINAWQSRRLTPTP
jgi:phthiocerol/phenolphthiocerol synthesis type-I polyketide synthase C